MTTRKRKQAKNIPAFYIYLQGPEDLLLPAGTAIKHRTGGGLNILIEDKLFLAYPAKAKARAGRP